MANSTDDSEWRQLIFSQLNELKMQQDKILEKINLMVSQSQYDKNNADIDNQMEKHDERIAKLEEFKWKLVGGLILFNVCLVAVVELIVSKK